MSYFTDNVTAPIQQLFKPVDLEYNDIDIIQLNNINQFYHDGGQKRVIFDNMNFVIKDVKSTGQFVVIVGPSGCGKSTILRYIAGLQKPTSGQIIINGKEQTPEDRVGMVFQQYSSLPWRTVMDNVALPLEIKGIKRQERESRAMDMIKLVGLEGHEYKFAQYPILSGGQLQRVALARNLVTDENILLLDEPHSGLDVQTKLAMEDLLSSIWNKIIEKDPTFILVTHDLNEAVYLADDIYVMDTNPGRVVEKIHISLGAERNKLMKREKIFNEYVHYLEDVMSNLTKK